MLDFNGVEHLALHILCKFILMSLLWISKYADFLFTITFAHLLHYTDIFSANWWLKLVLSSRICSYRYSLLEVWFCLMIVMSCDLWLVTNIDGVIPLHWGTIYNPNGGNNNIHWTHCIQNILLLSPVTIDFKW